MADVGYPLVLAVFVGCFMVPAIGVLGWCWSYDCVSTWHRAPSGSSEPFARHETTQSGGERWCWPLVVNGGAGKELRPDYSQMECQVTATAKDPNDAWHQASKGAGA